MDSRPWLKDFLLLSDTWFEEPGPIVQTKRTGESWPGWVRARHDRLLNSVSLPASLPLSFQTNPALVDMILFFIDRMHGRSVCEHGGDGGLPMDAAGLMRMIFADENEENDLNELVVKAELCEVAW